MLDELSVKGYEKDLMKVFVQIVSKEINYRTHCFLQGYMMWMQA
jgi:hypothetical protein